MRVVKKNKKEKEMPVTSDSETFRQCVKDMKVFFSNPITCGLLSGKAFNCNCYFSPFFREVLLGKIQPEKTFLDQETFQQSKARFLCCKQIFKSHLQGCLLRFF